MAVQEKVKSIIAEQLGVKPEEVTPEASFVDDLGADSLGLLNLAEAINARYGIGLQGDDLVDIANVGEFVKLVESKIALKS